MTIARIDISSLTKDLAKDLKKFERSCIPEAESAAILRVSRSALGKWVKAAAGRVRIKQGLLRRRSGNRKIKGGRMLTMNGAPVPLVIMGPKGRVPKQTKKGVRVAGRHHPQGFVATSRLGKRPEGKTIFERDGKPAHPISEVRVQVQDAVVSTGGRAVRQAVAERYPKEFDHALSRCLKRKTRFK